MTRPSESSDDPTIPPAANQPAAPIIEVNEGLTALAPPTLPVITPTAARALLQILLTAARTGEPEPPPTNASTETAPPNGTQT